MDFIPAGTCIYKCGKKKNVYNGGYTSLVPRPCPVVQAMKSWVGLGNDQGASLVPRLRGNETRLVHINTEDQV